MSWMKWILAHVFDCLHRRTTWPHHDGRGFDYVCCLECGKELPYSTRRMRIVSKEVLLAERNLKRCGEYRNQIGVTVCLTRNDASQANCVWSGDIGLVS